MQPRPVAAVLLVLSIGVAAAPPATAATQPASPTLAAATVPARQVPAAVTRAAIAWPGALRWGQRRTMLVRVSPVRAGRLVVLQGYWGSEQGWQQESRARTNTRGYARLTFQNLCFDGACGVARVPFRVVVPASGRDTGLVAGRRITIVP